MSKLVVIGLCGKARSGKDTVANHLVNEFGFTRIGLADGVRAAFADLDGPTWELRKELEAAGKTSRWALQTLGTECREFVGADTHWIDNLLIKINYLSAQHPIKRKRFVVSDIRFPVEVEIIDDVVRAWGGEFLCWKLTRPDSGLTGEAANHSSETLLGSIRADLNLANKSSLSDLKATAFYHATELLN